MGVEKVVADYRDLAVMLKRHTDAGRSVALTNGCFDLLHVGHVRLLEAAAEEADVLVVALNTDESVRGNKGPSRPLVPLAERMEVLAALECVDHVTSFPEPTADNLLETLRPNVYCKGTDWAADQVPERATAEKIHARIAICGDQKSHSSSELAERLGR
ncbi:MAG: adenylyltransferase/cytidyltransferase family protein [Planctomycetes bacterium]|nr:adenylyltransferase/cytidyltransferase family protein [Planctomycetota bacterium]